jgi:hypothetical protein
VGGLPSGTINDTANSILRSPNIDLTGITAATLSFAAALDSTAGDIIQVLVLEVGTDALLDTLTPFTVPVTANWASVGPLDLSAADNNNPLSPPSAPVQGRLHGPPAKSKFLAAQSNRDSPMIIA